MRSLPCCAGMLVLVGSLAAKGLRAQDAFVYYDHHPGAAGLDGRVSYVPSGHDSGAHLLGRPPTLVIPSGSRLCIEVVHGNPALYAYSLLAKTLPPDTIAGLSALITQLSGAITKPGPGGGSGASPVIVQVASLYAKLLEMQVYQFASDSIADFAQAAARMGSLYLEATGINRLAESLLQQRDTTLGPGVQELLRAVRAETWGRIGVINARFRHALEIAGDPMCTPVGTSRLRVTLQIARTLTDSAGKPLRPVGDSILTVIVDPRDERTFLVEPGFLLSVGTQDKSTIGLQGGVVTQTPDHSVGAHAAVFALARLGDIRWLWATLGVASAEKTVSDIFAGVTFRGGASLAGDHLSVGVGLALSRVPVGLSQGAVGSALPASVKSVSDIVQYGFRPGLGVTFAVQIP